MFINNKCAFSDLKHTEENVEYYVLFKERIMWSMHHNNVTFTDEKSFVLNDLLRLNVRRDPIIGEVPNVTCGSSVNVRKRCNMFGAIRPFNNRNFNKTLMCVIT